MIVRNDEYYIQLKREFKAIFKQIKLAERIVIFRHESPDFDALGTQMGLYEYIKKWWPEKEVHYVGDNSKTYMPRIFPYSEILDESFYTKPYLAIVVDVGDTKRISMKNFKNATCIIKIDHHPEVERFSNISCVHPEMCAASELTCLLLESMGGRRYPLNKEAARYFYIGIVGDSGRFMYPEVSPMSMRLAADLLDTGINKEEIYRQMYLTSQDEFNMKKHILTSYKITQGGTCYYIVNDEQLKQFNLEVSDTKVGIELFRNLEGIKAIVTVTQDISKNEYRVSLRSNQKPVNKVASMYNGGGHVFAAGCRLKSLEQLPGLLKAVDELNEVDANATDF